MLDMLGEANAAALIGLVGGIALGLAARIGRFCTLGAIEDLLYSSDDRRMRMWGIAIGVAIIGTHLALSFGALEGAETAVAVTGGRLPSFTSGNRLVTRWTTWRIESPKSKRSLNETRKKSRS